MERQTARPEVLIVESVVEGKHSQVEKLVKSGTNPDIVDWDGDSLLTLAVDQQDLRMVGYLLDQNADPNAQDLFGFSVLYHAVAEESDHFQLVQHTNRTSIIEIVSLLLAREADPNLPEADGQTPLILACAAGDVEVVKLLLSCRADPTEGDGDGECALSRARGKPQVLAELESYQRKNGANQPTQLKRRRSVIHSVGRSSSFASNGSANELLRQSIRNAPDVAIDEAIDTVRWNVREMLESYDGAKGRARAGKRSSRLRVANSGYDDLDGGDPTTNILMYLDEMLLLLEKSGRVHVLHAASELAKVMAQHHVDKNMDETTMLEEIKCNGYVGMTTPEDVIYILSEGDSKRDAVAVIHEAVHVLSGQGGNTQMKREYPHWNEGFALYFSRLYCASRGWPQFYTCKKQVVLTCSVVAVVGETLVMESYFCDNGLDAMLDVFVDRWGKRYASIEHKICDGTKKVPWSKRMLLPPKDKKLRREILSRWFKAPMDLAKVTYMRFGKASLGLKLS